MPLNQFRCCRLAIAREIQHSEVRPEARTTASTIRVQWTVDVSGKHAKSNGFNLIPRKTFYCSPRAVLKICIALAATWNSRRFLACVGSLLGARGLFFVVRWRWVKHGYRDYSRHVSVVMGQDSGLAVFCAVNDLANGGTKLREGYAAGSRFHGQIVQHV